MLLRDWTRPSRSVIGWLVGGVLNRAGSRRRRPVADRHRLVDEGVLGDMPSRKAAPYTKGLKVEPGWRRAWLTWSNCSCAKSALPTQAFTCAVARIDGQEAGLQQRRSSPLRRPRSASVLQLPHLPRDRLVGRLLQARVDGGAHHQAVGVDVVVLAVGPGDQPLAHLLRHVRRDAHRLVLPLEVQPQRPRRQHLGALRHRACRT
jgi:hypothetical protein